MRAKILFFFLLISSSFIDSYAQLSTGTSLTWMKGDNTVNQSGIYGTKGVTDAANKPGARDYSATWTDANNTLWMFGGYGFDEDDQGYLNDLWKFDPLTNQWTWVNGNKTINSFGVYGTKGIANPNNKPGSLYASVCWTDKNGNLWLFGGFGYSSNDIGFINDLWKYEPATGNWTWIKGNNAINKPGTYGTMGVASSTNQPGSRYGGKTWTDKDGNLWLFGGYGIDQGNTGTLNDLWKYDITTNKWTWVRGNKTIDQPGNYGTQGVASSTSQPGARYLSNSWIDKNGNFWLFGGYGLGEENRGTLNDLWKYNVTANTWTWIKGDKIADRPGVYGTMGVPETINHPGSRYVSVSWSDEFGDLWMFGGLGYDETRSGYLNDLWKFDIATGTWTWMKGDNLVDQVGVYGTQGVPAYTNKSGARNSCISWKDASGNLWMFGGYGYDQATPGVLSDLWKITQLVVLPLELLEFNGTLNDDIAQISWKTAQEEDFLQFNLQRSYDGSTFETIATIAGKGQSENEYRHLDNTLAGNPSTQVFYRLEMQHAGGEVNYSKLIRLERKTSNTQLRLFPNPASTSITLTFTLERSNNIAFQISDNKGSIVRSFTRNFLQGSSSINIDINSLPRGVYYVSMSRERERESLKFVIGN